VGEQVSVESFEALSSLRTALARFVDNASAVLYSADAHLQRTKTWVKTEQANHWKAEGRKRAELLIQAKLALKAKKLMPSALGGRQTCVDEEKAVKLAERRMEEAEQKAKNVKLWTRKIDEEGLAYGAVASGMKQACTIEVPAAIARLDGMLAALEAYAAQAPRSQGSVAVATGAEDAQGQLGSESMARGTPQAQQEDIKALTAPESGAKPSAQGDDQGNPS